MSDDVQRDAPVYEALAAVLQKEWLQGDTRLQPFTFGLGAADPTLTYPLLPTEAKAALGVMLPRRLAEFSAGRFAARAAFTALGEPAHAVPKGADRAPIWPAGIRATLSHSRLACLCLATKAPLLLGLDIELRQTLAAPLVARFRSPQDRLLPDHDDSALWLFCAKEAAFKAQYALTQRSLLPHEITVILMPDGFVANIAGLAAPLEGRIISIFGHVMALAWGAEPSDQT